MNEARGAAALTFAAFARVDDGGTVDWHSTTFVDVAPLAVFTRVDDRGTVESDDGVVIFAVALMRVDLAGRVALVAVRLRVGAAARL